MVNDRADHKGIVAINNVAGGMVRCGGGCRWPLSARTEELVL